MSPETRQQLIRAAIELFSKRGYEAVSTREIAELAGVNLGAIQYHFGNKAELFIETVRQLMNDTGTRFRDLETRPHPTTLETGAQRLCEVICAFVEELSRIEKPQGCQMMCREALSQRPDEDGMVKELVKTVVSEFFGPFHLSLIAVLRILAPKLNDQQLSLTANSIISQCVFYSTHRAFIELINQKQLNDPEFLKAIEEHICHFSFKALGLPIELCASSLEKARAGLNEAEISKG